MSGVRDQAEEPIGSAIMFTLDLGVNDVHERPRWRPPASLC
jgi:hypothetical protein